MRNVGFGREVAAAILDLEEIAGSIVKRGRWLIRDAREVGSGDWLNPHALYRAQGQTVRLYFVGEALQAP